MNGRERALAHLRGEPVDQLPCLPITMMLAADAVGERYLEYATDYRVLAAGQASVAERFRFDHVSVISDPGVEAADCGATVQYFDDQPPAIVEEQALLADATTLLTLPPPDKVCGKRMQNRVDGVAELRRRAGGDKLVEGWVEGPCAEAADLRGINTLMLDFFDQPEFVVDLFEYLSALAISFARMQVDAGADIIGVGDAAASLVGPAVYKEFVWPYENRVVEAIHGMGAMVRLHICGDIRRSLAEVGRLGCDVVDIDSMVPLDMARELMGPKQVLAGNLDPVRVLRNGDVAGVHDALNVCRHAAMPRYIVAAGCEIPRDSPPTNVMALSDFAATFNF